MKKQYSIIFILVATELIGFGLIIPVLPQISEQYTSSGILIGLLLASYSLAQFFSAPILGKWSDQIGRKPILIISKIGTILSYVLLAISNNYILLLLSRLLDGFTGGNIAVARAYLSDISTEDNRSKAMAIVGVSFAIGFILGPAIGGYCYKVANNFEIAGYVGASLSFISLIITIFGIKEPKRVKHVKNRPFMSSIKTFPKQTIIILLTYGLIMIIFSGFETSFSVYTHARFGLSESQNSLLFLYIGIAAFFVQGSLMKIAIKPFKIAVIFTITSMGIGLVLTNLIQPMWASLSMLLFLVFGIGVANTHFPAELTRISSNEKGVVLGVYESIGSIARIIGPLFVYLLLYKYISIIYLLMGIFILSIMILLLPFLTAKQ